MICLIIKKIEETLAFPMLQCYNTNDNTMETAKKSGLDSPLLLYA